MTFGSVPSYILDYANFKGGVWLQVSSRTCMHHHHWPCLVGVHVWAVVAIVGTEATPNTA